MSTNEVGWVVGVAGVVVALAWLLGGVQAKKPRQGRTKPAKQTSSSPAAETANQGPVAAPDLVDEDDFNLQIDRTESDEVTEEVEVVPEITESMVEVIEHVEPEPEPVDITPSGRLASLREEMGDGDVQQREGSIEDRMKKFFGDGE